jgi:hypothetical protein
MTCVNWYHKFDDDDDDDDSDDNDHDDGDVGGVDPKAGNELGPTIKNIDFKISEDIFEKW